MWVPFQKKRMEELFIVALLIYLTKQPMMNSSSGGMISFL